MLDALPQERARPVTERFFAWIDDQFTVQGLLPSSPFTKAVAYARERKEGLLLYLNDADVEIDTNSLERALRAIGTKSARSRWASFRVCW